MKNTQWPSGSDRGVSELVAAKYHGTSLGVSGRTSYTPGRPLIACEQMGVGSFMIHPHNVPEYLLRARIVSPLWCGATNCRIARLF